MNIEEVAPLKSLPFRRPLLTQLRVPHLKRETPTTLGRFQLFPGA